MSIFSDQMMFHCPPMVKYKWNSNIADHEVAPNCPRCASSNTKFCYYNNYSLSQPRYFCKGCRRYWTRGGSLRNVPVGGGCRKNRRAKAAHRTIDRTNLHSISSRFDGEQQSYEHLGSPNSDSSTTHSNGSEIDMALVFAKYLNQDSSSGEELRDEALGTSGSTNSLNQDYNRPENHVAMECGQDYLAMDLIGGSNSIEQVVPHQEILAENEFGVLGVVEEVSQDALWCDDANTLPQLTWQSAVQLPEFDAFHDSDHDRCFRIPTNLISDGWSSFNLPMLDNQNAAVLNW